MKKRFLHIVLPVLLMVLASVYSTALFAQVKVGNNPTTINPNAVVEMESNNKGLLLPRLALVSTTNPAPLNAFVNGMLVYNTATTDSITPGLFYSDGIKWVKINQPAPSGGPLPSTGWNLTGNSGTNPSSNFVGTTDNAALSFKTNNTEQMRITENGWVGIGTATPTAALQIKGQLVIDSLSSGNIHTDSILVANPANGKVKMVSAASLGTGVQKKMEVVATTGQTIFNTPGMITDINKILLYRNGVMISFTMNNATSITSEVTCTAGDEIRIIQFL
jgi:hypothetical protein